ncbi:hypothetical protein HZ994_01035 [Akkermansiaceae bacterium]|nr:hypothetical protein HZ994_01035 [Akkermansiaceae bacterium]
MPEPSSEQEKYTIDEMMDRLKGRDTSGKSPELVTRPDGSQAMKVKKRRRRTNQAVNSETKRNHRVQIIQIAGFVVVVVLLSLAVGIGVLYANSASFRESLLGKMEDASGAEMSLTQFRMNPANANANAAKLLWPGGNALSEITLGNITAKISPSSFLGNEFGGEEVVAAKGTLVLAAPTQGEPARHKPGSGEMPVKFRRYSVPSLEVFFGNAPGNRRYLKGTEASFFPSTAAGQAEIRLLGGLLEFDGWPLAALDRSYIKVKGGSFQIQSMRFTVPKAANERKPEKGFIDFSGNLRPLEIGATHTIEANVREMPLPYLAGADLGRFFLGTVDSKEIPDSNFLTIPPDEVEQALLDLTLTNSLDSRIDLGGFRFLSQLAKALDDRWYEFPNFTDNVGIVLKRRGGEVNLSEINMVSRGRMAVRGNVSNGNAGAITGTLRVGIPETTVAASKNKRLDLLFGSLREGYRWVDIEVGGTSAVPADNFLELYNKAAESPREEESPAPKPGPDSFEDLIDGGE